MGPAGPTSISDLADSAGQDATAQAAGLGWADVSFADGGRYVVATACDLASQVSQFWVADLIPAAGGKGRMLGTVTDAAGDPESAAAIVSGPVSSSALVCLRVLRSADSAGQGPRAARAGSRGPDHRHRRRAQGRTGLAVGDAGPAVRRSGPRREQAGAARRGGHPAGAASTAAGRRRDQPGRPYPGAHAVSGGGQQHRAMVTGRAADRLLPGQPAALRPVSPSGPWARGAGRSCSPGTTTWRATSCSGHRTGASSSTRPRRPSGA